MVKNIAVFGSTEFLDLPIAVALSEAGYNVSVMTKDVDEARKIFPETIHIVEGNLYYHHDLKRFLSTQDAVYCSLSIDMKERPNDFHSETDGLREIINVSLECGIKRIAYLSSILQYNQVESENNWWVFNVKKDAVNYVRDCGIPFTIFYASTFMENFLSTYRQGKIISVVGESRFPIYFVSVSDYTKAVVNSFKILGTEDEEYFIQGLDCYTMQEAARIFIKNSSTPGIKLQTFPMWMARILSLFSTKWKFIAELSDALNNNNEIFVAESTWMALGRPEVKFTDFAKKH
jgi:nucleoside-diphosphate-sugar epimerase